MSFDTVNLGMISSDIYKVLQQLKSHLPVYLLKTNRLRLVKQLR